MENYEDTQNLTLKSNKVLRFLRFVYKFIRVLYVTWIYYFLPFTALIVQMYYVVKKNKLSDHDSNNSGQG